MISIWPLFVPNRMRRAVTATNNQAQPPSSQQFPVSKRGKKAKKRISRRQGPRGSSWPYRDYFPHLSTCYCRVLYAIQDQGGFLSIEMIISTSLAPGNEQGIRRELYGNCTGIQMEMRRRFRAIYRAFYGPLPTNTYLWYVWTNMDRIMSWSNPPTPLTTQVLDFPTWQRKEDGVYRCVVGGRRKAPDTQYTQIY